MTRFLTGSLLVAASTLLAAEASAHITLKSPKPRYDATLLKDGPCGKLNGGKSANVTTFAPGEKITVTWQETIDHPGHFRISFDDDGDDAFQDPASFDDIGSGLPILVDDIADKIGGGMYSQEITLPNIECDNCTLQVIQVMTDKPPYGDGNDIYYQCADLVLSASGSGGSSAVSSGAGGTTSAGSTTGGTTDGAGVGGGSAVGAGSGAAGPTSQTFSSDTDTGGCSVRAQSGAGSWVTAPLLGMLFAFALRRRRRC